MKKYQCLCCGCRTLDSRAGYDICPVCFWEDDAYLDPSAKPIQGIYFDGEPPVSELLDIPSGANHGMTLRKAQENYRLFGACEKDMLPHVRKPHSSEK